MDFSNIFPQIGSTSLGVVALFVGISLIVAVHEYGHYIIARISGIKAEVFSLGFGPVLFSRVDRHGTRWQFALVPLGGFVRFLGDANAASVGANNATPVMDQRQTMAGAPLWARAATVAAGPMFNFVFAALLFAFVALGQGKLVEPFRVNGFADLPTAPVSGLMIGDEIMGVGPAGSGAPEPVGASSANITPAPTVDYRVVREGQEVVLPGPYPYPPLILAVNPGSPAYQAGLQRGDVISSINGTPIYAFSELVAAVSSSDGKSLRLGIYRSGQTFSLDMTPERVDLPRDGGGFETRWLIGVAGGFAFDLATENVAFGELATGAVDQLWLLIRVSLSGMWHMVAGDISTCNVSGPVGIAEVMMASAHAGWSDFLFKLGMLSAGIGLMNLFPIPVLDGGHLVIFGYEAVFRRQPSTRALQILLSVGLGIILAMMFLALANDLYFCR